MGMLVVSGGDGQQGADGAVGYGNAEPQCLQWHGMHALSKLMAMAKPFFITLHGQPPGTSVGSTRFTLHQVEERPKGKVLPPTPANQLLLTLQANL